MRWNWRLLRRTARIFIGVYVLVNLVRLFLEGVIQAMHSQTVGLGMQALMLGAAGFMMRRRCAARAGLRWATLGLSAREAGVGR